jgi:hypothetical protein
MLKPARKHRREVVAHRRRPILLKPKIYCEYRQCIVNGYLIAAEKAFEHSLWTYEYTLVTFITRLAS